MLESTSRCHCDWPSCCTGSTRSGSAQQGQGARSAAVRRLRAEADTHADPTIHRKASASSSKGDVGSLHLGPSSSADRLSNSALGASLGYSLVLSAFESWKVLSVSPTAPSSRTFLENSFRTGDAPNSPELEVRLRGSPTSLGGSLTTWAHLQIRYSCYVAIGARRSNHSAIVGDSQLVVQDPLGARRETACRALAERAVTLLGSSKKTLILPELISLVKATFLCTSAPAAQFSELSLTSPCCHCSRRARN